MVAASLALAALPHLGVGPLAILFVVLLDLRFDMRLVFGGLEA